MSCFSKKESEDLSLHNKEPELRMVLLGKVRVGKSASGNTILGQKNRPIFLSKSSLTGVTEMCQKKMMTIDGQNVVVVDTPGLFHIDRTEENLVIEIKKSISLAKPGPHVFLIVLSLMDTYTNEEKDMVEIICNTFGKHTMAYTMVLFTYGSTLQDTSIEEFIRSNKNLHDLIKQCNWSYHVFDNHDKSPVQVTELLQQINKRIQTQGRNFYTPEMLQKAEITLHKKQQDPKGEVAKDRAASLRTCAFSGIGVGCLMGYLAGGGQVTSSVGAALGGAAGGILAVLAAGLVIFVKDKMLKVTV